MTKCFWTECKRKAMKDDMFCKKCRDEVNRDLEQMLGEQEKKGNTT